MSRSQTTYFPKCQSIVGNFERLNFIIYAHMYMEHNNIIQTIYVTRVCTAAVAFSFSAAAFILDTLNQMVRFVFFFVVFHLTRCTAHVTHTHLPRRKRFIIFLFLFLDKHKETPFLFIRVA